MAFTYVDKALKLLYISPELIYENTLSQCVPPIFIEISVFNQRNNLTKTRFWVYKTTWLQIFLTPIVIMCATPLP